MKKLSSAELPKAKYLLLDDLPSYLSSAKQIKLIKVCGYDPIKVPPVLEANEIAICHLPDMVFFIKNGKPFCTLAGIKRVEIDNRQDNTVTKLNIVTGSRYGTLFDTFYEFEIIPKEIIKMTMATTANNQTKKISVSKFEKLCGSSASTIKFKSVSGYDSSEPLPDLQGLNRICTATNPNTIFFCNSEKILFTLFCVKCVEYAENKKRGRTEFMITTAIDGTETETTYTLSVILK